VRRVVEEEYSDQYYSLENDSKMDSTVLLLSVECERSSFETGPIVSECLTAVASSYWGSVRHFSA